MRHLRSGVIVQRRVICHHAAKQRHIHRGRCFQGIPILLFIRRALHSQLCQRLCLRSAHEKQRLGDRIILLALFIELDARILQRFLCQLVRIRIRSQCKDLLLYQFCGLFSALANVQLSILRKGCAHGMLPCLRGNSGALHTAVHCRFGAAGIVPVDAAGRDGLQNVEINIQALIHNQFSFSFSSGAGFGSRYRSCPHRRRTLAGVCAYRGSAHCNSYRSAASCG